MTGGNVPGPSVTAPSYTEGLLFGAGCIATVLALWWLLTLGEGDARLIDAYTLPSPAETFGSFSELWKRELSRSIVISLAGCSAASCWPLPSACRSG
jgi:ABC-type nitrate/sulfonate/bicarbonate transport system permease component